MEALKDKKYNYFIGIDVSRNKLDIAVMRDKELLFHKEIENDSLAISEFLQSLKPLPKFVIRKSVFGLEQTGIYSTYLIGCLLKFKADLVIEHPLQIRNSLGNLRGKYDKIDSIRIAQYLFKSRDSLRLWKQRRRVIDQLSHLSTLRARLITTHKSLLMPLKEQAEFINKTISNQSSNLCMASIASLKADIIGVDQAIKAIVNEDTEIKRLMRLITSVPSIGPVTALQIVISTNEFKDIRNPKKFASYSGVAPFKDDSGKSVKKAKVSNLANKKMKALLHICAVCAVSYDSDLRAYYKRKTVIEGKAKMAVINAIRYKLILRIFACLTQNRMYEKNYNRSSNLIEVAV